MVHSSMYHDLQHVRSLLQGFLNEVVALDVQLLEGGLQVADAPVDQLRRSAGSAAIHVYTGAV